MIIVDANLLLYAYNPDAPQFERSRDWLGSVFATEPAVGLPWLVTHAFMRVGTNPRLFDRPLSPTEVTEIVENWLQLPNVRVPEPHGDYWLHLRSLVTATNARGPAVSDAALAALSIEHAAILHTADRDFARFPGLKWKNPLE